VVSVILIQGSGETLAAMARMGPFFVVGIVVDQMAIFESDSIRIVRRVDGRTGKLDRGSQDP